MESFTIERQIKNVNWLKALLFKSKLRASITIDLPTQWNELTADQFEMVAALLFSERKEIDAMAELVVKFCGFEKWELSFVSNDDIFCQILPCFEFVKTPVIIQKPIIKKVLNKYYGPKEDLSGMCWKQFVLAETYCNAFQISKDINHLNKLVAVLYCSMVEYPASDNWELGLSESFQQKIIGMLHLIPVGLKQACYLNYLGLKAYLIEQEVFPKLFPVGKTTETEVTDNKPGAIDWHKVSLGLCGEKFGTIEQLYYTPVHDVMKFIDMQNEKV